MRRSLLLSIAVLFAFVCAGCSSSSVTQVQPVTSQPVTVARGAVLALTKVGTITKAQMTAGIAGSTIAEFGGPPQCDVTLYAITYETIGAHGEPANTSGAFFVPATGCQGPFPLVAYAQGTNVIRAQKITDPTARNIEPVVIAAIYAAHGDAVAATEYLGLGYSTYPYQPYLVVNSEASAVIDSMRASRNAAKTLGVPLSSEVLVTGYSQGGHAAMGTQRAIEADEPSEFHLIAGAPASGPYALEKTTVDGIAHPGMGAPTYSTYMLTAFEKTYDNVYTDPTQVFQNPYANGIDSLLPVNTYAEAVALNGKTLPLALSALLQPAFVKSFTTDPKNGARVDLGKNDLLNGWKPVAPVALCGGSKDPVVNYENSQLAYAYFQKEGVKVTLTDMNGYIPPTLPRSEYHDAILLFCLTYNRATFLDKKPNGAHTFRSMRAGTFSLHPGNAIPE
jgi:Secretory lipase